MPSDSSDFPRPLPPQLGGGWDPRVAARMQMRQERLAAKERSRGSGRHGGRGGARQGRHSDRAERQQRTALSRERIVETAIGMLDEIAASGSLNTADLTLRKLAQELRTGPASLYWHAKNRSELMSMITAELIGRALDNFFAQAPLDERIRTHSAYRPLPGTGVADGEAIRAIRTLILYLFEQMLQHPWLARELVDHGPDSENAVAFWECIGEQFALLPLEVEDQFYYSMAVTNHASGTGAEISTHMVGGNEEQEAPAPAAPDQYPFIASVSEYFARHDAVRSFVSGLDLLLLGLEQVLKKTR